MKKYDEELIRNLAKAEIIAKASLVFWMLETVVFLFIHGWHTKPIGVEKCFDFASLVLFFTAVAYYVKAINESILLIVGLYKAFKES